MTDKKKIVEKLRKYISEYDKVVVLGEGISASEKFIRIILQQTAKKILLLVNGTIQDDIQKRSVDIETISCEEYCDIERLYYMYEFSDRVYLLNDSAQYGRLNNYISNGLLTEEEAIMALLFG